MGNVLGAEITGLLVPGTTERVVRLIVGVPETAMGDISLEDPVVILPVEYVDAEEVEDDDGG